MSRTDQSPVTPGTSSSASERPAYEARSDCHALSSRLSSCDLFKLTSRILCTRGQSRLRRRARRPQRRPVLQAPARHV